MLFVPRTIPDAAALRALTRLERQLADAVVGEHPDVLAVWGELFPLPVGWEDGIDLPAHLLLLGADILFDDAASSIRGRWHVELSTASQSLSQSHLYPSVYVMGNKLFLTDIRHWFGGELHGWENVESFRIRYVPTLAALDAPGDTITLPDSAQGALVAGLALWMADRVGAKLPTLREAANASGAAWLMSMANLGSTRSWQVEYVE